VHLAVPLQTLAPRKDSVEAVPSLSFVAKVTKEKISEISYRADLTGLSACLRSCILSICTWQEGQVW